ncbi:MAG: hypothetical protein ACK2UY_00460 [Anaerolineae bacterium]
MRIAPPFDISLFVPCKGAYQWVLTRVKRWQEAQPDAQGRPEGWRVLSRRPSLAPGDRVLILSGERGAGKSWLLQYMAEHDRQTSPGAVYIDLEKRLVSAGAEAWVQAVERQVFKRCGQGSALLLLDAVPPQLDHHLRALEEWILRPHLAHRSSMVVMALDHPSQVCWRAPALRGGESYALTLFEEPESWDQLRRLRQRGLMRDGLDDRAILEQASGLPLLTYLLATHERREAFELLLQHWFSRIPDEDCERMWNYTIAVSPLRVLEHVTIERMLEVYYRVLPEAAGYPAHPSGVRNALLKHWLARMVPGAPGRIALVPSVRHAAVELLKAIDPPLYIVLREMAQVLGGGQQ